MQRTVKLPTIHLQDEEAVAGTNRIRLVKAEETQNDRRWFDKMRNLVQAHEYLCHVAEAVEWIEDFLDERIDNNDDREASILQIEKTLHDGVVLAKLARRIHPGIINSIISSDEKFKFLRSNNINAFLQVLKEVRLPSIFWFEFVDLYDQKNIPKVIYCIHALSHWLYSNDSAPKIRNLNGELNFSEAVLVATQRNLEMSGATMPNFSNLGLSMQKELNGNKRSRFAFKPIDDAVINDSNEVIPKTRQVGKLQPKDFLMMTDLYDSDTESKSSSSDEQESISVPTMQRLTFLGVLIHRNIF
ncbi:calponin homology domain-containing protein [Mycotypha africana]|uniref:calponin domain-containing protein n=1 Tax=Mycotypha africana TaxID=64632 RepID=UPI0023015EBF|nr:calponin domain-containing protein [Mycotypha africana]KAI8982301.1 calponin homology domain-containing protein [Mycotypha africana]